jgi:hypothetical protein
MPEPESEKRVIIDEDWKAQVQRDKDQARCTTEAPEGAPLKEEPAPLGEEDERFLSLVNSVAAQTAFTLGLVAEPNTKQVVVDLGQAQYLIDTLMMLREKTKGHLTPKEEGHLMAAISDLQRVYVVRVQQAQEAALRTPGTPKTP